MLPVIIFSILFLLIIANNLTTSKLSFHLIAIYILWYGGWLIVSTFNPFELFEVSTKAYIYQLLGVSSLVLGFLFHPDLKTNNSFSEQREISTKFEKSIFFKLNVIIVCFLAIYTAVLFWNLVIYDPIGARGIYFEELRSNIGIPYFHYLWNWYGRTIITIVLLLICMHLIKRKQVNKFFLLMYVVTFLSYSFVGLGRGRFVELLYFYTTLIVINHKTGFFSSKSRIYWRANYLNWKMIILSFFLGSIVLLVMGYFTSVRLGESELTLANSVQGVERMAESLVLYNVGGFRAFDHALKNDYIQIIGQLYGRGTFASVDNLLVFPIRQYVAANNIIGNELQYNRIMIGPNTSWNYAYTQFLIFYLDFKLLGILLVSFLMGYFYKKAILIFMKKTNFFSLLLLVFLTSALFSSNFAYQLQSTTSLLIISTAIFFSNYRIKLAA